MNQIQILLKISNLKVTSFSTIVIIEIKVKKLYRNLRKKNKIKFIRYLPIPFPKPEKISYNQMNKNQNAFFNYSEKQIK